MSYLKSDLPLITLLESKVLLGIHNINFGKNSSLTEAVKYLINQGKRISIFNCHGV